MESIIIYYKAKESLWNKFMTLTYKAVKVKLAIPMTFITHVIMLTKLIVFLDCYTHFFVLSKYLTNTYTHRAFYKLTEETKKSNFNITAIF